MSESIACLNNALTVGVVDRPAQVKDYVVERSTGHIFRVSAILAGRGTRRLSAVSVLEPRKDVTTVLCPRQVEVVRTSDHKAVRDAAKMARLLAGRRTW
jgi:hypothetical protein